MKLFSTLALSAAVAVLAMSGSVSESLAAKAKAKPKAAAAAACKPAGSLKTAACGPSGCTMQRCWADGQWRQSLVVCLKPWCPK